MGIQNASGSRIPQSFYVGPELRSRDQDKHQCTTVIESDDDLRPENANLENQEWDSRPEFQSNPDERYGWWANHDTDKSQKVAMFVAQ
ncbi:hypothetical protein PHMEG_0002851 [Phytophthora megakarya]|uniref:Uncharacterized protein n=1 Tax=Phytophthora megakarya TaxID=4795 RepID=A0A225WXJ0_9STRA|nr:hypothetical protein PHMEG_0002851 [Phytophthora megakarya]